ncbi:MAG: 4-phosphoerythronate dehydrogenase [Candidatus Cryptobacteroides sp.]
MKLLIDNEIPFINGVFEPYGEVQYLHGDDINPDSVRNADAILVKGRTRCDEALLEGSSVKMIATTLVGIDHIDMDYCDSHGIYVQNAKGTISGAVSNYVFSAIYGCAAKSSINLSGATIGILGYGSVGKRIESVARALGFKVLIEDPPKANVESPSQFCDLNYLLENSDIVTLHIPLNERTRGMCNAEFFSKMKFGSFFINTASGALVVDEDLIEASPRLGPIIIDCWNGEPDINRNLLDVTDIGTPHISGYSYQSKLSATRSVVRSVARFFGINELYDFFPKPDIEGMDSIRVDIMGKTQGQVASIFQYNYPIFTDDFLFRMSPESFTELRIKYKYRREFHIL